MTQIDLDDFNTSLSDDLVRKKEIDELNDNIVELYQSNENLLDGFNAQYDSITKMQKEIDRLQNNTIKSFIIAFVICLLNALAMIIHLLNGFF